MEALIEIENLSRYYGDFCAVREVSFQLQRGEILGFLGPNGAGKSTTMRMLSGGLAPSNGSIHLHGIDLLQNPVAAKQRLGYLPEQPPLYPELTVDEYLRFCARLRRVSDNAAALQRTKQQCGLEQSGGRLIANLSKGYRQRVGIAQAIIHDPEIIILDEPTSGLDPNQIREIRLLIRQLGEKYGVLLSTHILPEVETVCDRVLILHQGELVFAEALGAEQRQGPPPSIIVGLCRPPETELLQQLAGVDAVEELGDNRFRLQLDTGADTAALSESLVQAGWGLAELAPEYHDLERIFTRLTTTEAA
jgi:ABC-2 type transport system ATP-binding protein